MLGKGVVFASRIHLHPCSELHGQGVYATWANLRQSDHAQYKTVCTHAEERWQEWNCLTHGLPQRESWNTCQLISDHAYRMVIVSPFCKILCICITWLHLQADREWRLPQFCMHLVTYCRPNPDADYWFPVWLNILFDYFMCMGCSLQLLHVATQVSQQHLQSSVALATQRAGQ